MLDNTILHGKYRIEGLLGNGAFSAVYLALEILCDRRVAVKALRPDIYENGAARYVFREMAVMGRLWQHPNIVGIHTVEPGDEECAAYIVMEYVSGGSLRRLLQETRLPLYAALAIAYDVANGLAYAHQQNVVHRDIKPRNILLTAQSVAKVSDFGVSHAREMTHDFASTFAGTRRYMAPEQYDGQYDHRVDLYALGLTLWEMLTAGFPFPGETQEQIRAAKSRGCPEPPSDLPQPVREILAMSLSTEPHNRYPTMRHMRDALMEILEGEYERLAVEHAAPGATLESLQPVLKPKRQPLRMDDATAMALERLALGSRHTAQQYRESAEAVQDAESHAEALGIHVCKAEWKSVSSALERLRDTHVVPDGVMELVDLLCLRLQGTEGISTPPARGTGTELFRRAEREADVFALDGDIERAAAVWQETAATLEQEKKWGKARAAHRRCAEYTLQTAMLAAERRDSPSAAHRFQRAGQCLEAGGDRRKATKQYLRAAECWREVAQTHENAREFAFAAEAYRSVAHAYELAKQPNMTRHFYDAAAKMLCSGAERALARGQVAEANSLCRHALDLANTHGHWTLSDEIRQLQARIRQAANTSAGQ